MLKIDRDSQSFTLLDTPSLADVSITERYDLQEFISNSPAAFFKEIGQDLFLLGKEIVPSKNVQDRIDLLALDREGNCVVIELKRGNHKLQLFQAISYAGMIAQWRREDFLQLLSEERQEALSNFLDVDTEDINRQQQIIMVAEAYDYALLTGTEWLCERYGVAIVCCRIALAKDSATNAEYLVCSNVYPAPELAKEAIPRGRSSSSPNETKWPSWEVALSGVANADLVSYFQRELAASRESYLPRRTLRYRAAGRRHWYMHARRNLAYIWQEGRFEGDLEFWMHGVSAPDEVKPVKRGTCLRFSLSTTSDFAFFNDAVTGRLQSVEWLADLPEADLEEPDLD